MVFIGMVILGWVLTFLNRKKQKTWLFILTLVVDIIAVIGCTYNAVQCMKMNKQSEVTAIIDTDVK